MINNIQFTVETDVTSKAVRVMDTVKGFADSWIVEIDVQLVHEKDVVISTTGLRSILLSKLVEQIDKV